MKIRFLLALVLTLTIASMALAQTVLAGDIFHFRGENAYASFYSSSPDGCISTYVGVSAGEDVGQSPPGPSSPQSFAAIYIDQFDYCTSTGLISASGYTDAPAFQMDNFLTSATLNATINVFDYVSNTWFAVAVDMDWTGTGDLNRGNSHSHYQSPDCTFNYQSNGTWRSAEASGSVSMDTTNFTPNPSQYADLSSSKSGQVSIGCQ